MARTAVIGIGNVMMSDDGAGVRVLELLKGLPSDVEIIELATGGMTLLHRFEGLETAIIVDAADFGGKPGEVSVFLPEQVESLKSVGYSLHDLDLLKVLELAKQMGTLPKNVFIVAVQPKSLEMGEGLSPEVEEALAKMAEEITILVRLRGVYS